MSCWSFKCSVSIVSSCISVWGCWLLDSFLMISQVVLLLLLDFLIVLSLYILFSPLITFYSILCSVIFIPDYYYFCMLVQFPFMSTWCFDACSDPVIIIIFISADYFFETETGIKDPQINIKKEIKHIIYVLTVKDADWRHSCSQYMQFLTHCKHVHKCHSFSQ
jgi:hypothetical protein